MNRVKRMQPVLRLAELEVDKAGRHLAMIQHKVEAEQAKLVQLQEYQQEYRERLQTAGQAGMTVDRLRLFDGFHQQLDRAIDQQARLIAQLQIEQIAVRETWQQKDIRFKSLQKMLERLQKESTVQQNRNEQRNHDEYARRRSSDNGWT
ncbi:MAG: flagellar export protein FliJ [Pseudohongiella sp.]|nr:flagellar export protein FliJ [Pseudohongiella sp.]MDP2127459.1 flagellar export protein FliJ [Pseudohongiella sp.]